MSDRASVFQTVYVGRETTAGSFVAPDRQLAALSIELTPGVTVQTFRPSGYVVHTVAATNYQQSDWQAEGIGTYNEITIPLRLLLGAPTTTGTAPVYEHEWLLNSSQSTAQNTYTVVVGDSTRNALTNYMLLQSLQLTATSQAGLQIQASGVARRWRDDCYRQFSVVNGTPTGGTWDLTIGTTNVTGLAYNITASALQTALTNAGIEATVTGGAFPGAALHVFFTDTPGAISVTDTFTPGGDVEVSRVPTATMADVVPIVGSHITHRSAGAYAGLSSASPLTRVFNWQFQFDNRAGVFAPMDASGTFAAHVETAPNARLTVQVGADSNGMAYFSNLTANTRLFWRLRADGSNIGTSSTPHRFEVDVSMLLSEVRLLRDADGIVQASFTGTLAHDPTWGRALRMYVRNGDATAL